MENKEKSELQAHVVSLLKQNPHGRLILAPRSGKTKIMIDYIKYLKPESVLWVTPSVQLASVDIPKEFEKWDAEEHLENLCTITWASLHKMRGQYELIILDEEQHITELNSTNLVNKHLIGNIISMTGTKTRHQNKKDLYKKLDLDIIYELGINNAVDIGLLSNYTINVMGVDMDIEKNIHVKTKKYNFMTSEVKQYNAITEKINKAKTGFARNLKFMIMHRMRMIKDSPSKLKYAQELLTNLKGRVLIFSGSIKQAEALCEHTYHSKTNSDDYEAFQKGDIDRIAMVNSGGSGHTYKEIDHLVLVQADSDANRMTSQKICRVLLKQKNYNATIWIICLRKTQDEVWVESTLKTFDEDKIIYV